MKKTKLKHFASVSDMLMGNEINYDNDQIKKPKNKEFLNILEQEIDSSQSSTLVQKIECPEVLEGVGAIAWRFCNDKYKCLPSSTYIDNKKYNIGFLNYLKEHGLIVYRRIYATDNFPDLGYIFLYKECYYTINITFGDEDSVMINGYGAYHPVNMIPDFREFEKFEQVEKELPKIGIIKTTRYGPAVSWIDHKVDITFSNDNYNEDFEDFFGDLKTKLTSDAKTGLYLFYGEAGTGKSSAIRHLISQVSRRVVFIPPQMINCLSSPDFTDLITTSLKGCILVIEDAEKALMKRESEDGFFNSELVSSILNLTDGLYSDLSQTAIIATYNCDRNLIDPALLRKGRLRSEYHFQKLSIDRSQKLMDDLGHEHEVQDPMTLADIFNYEKQYSNKKSEKKRSVGFGG